MFWQFRMKLPVFSIDKIYHLGSLDSSKRSALSYEGHTLSASTCPEAWEKIARLGGNPCHKLEKKGALFLDVESLLNNTALEKRLLKFGKDNGFIELRNIYEISWYDEEMEDTMSFRCLSSEEAFNEMDEDRSMKELSEWIETPLLLERTSQSRKVSASNPRQLLAVLYAEHLSEKGYPLDGVFMDHQYAPDHLSAPAFGILPGKLKSFAVDVVPMPEDIPDVRSVGKDHRLDIAQSPAKESGLMPSL